VTTPARSRFEQVDYVKGIAIFCVICIHARLGVDTLVFDQLIDRAVPIFLVLFGTTSELWWTNARGASLKQWYASRFMRLMIPVWTAGAIWWLLALWTGQVAAKGLGLRQLLATFIGYSPWIGISWFITLILQLVVVFPALRWLVNRLGNVASLALAAAVTVAGTWFMWDIIDAGKWLLASDVPEPAWYYHWIFWPRVTWEVVAGIVIARIALPPKPLTLALAAVLAALVIWLPGVVRGGPEDAVVGALRVHVVSRLGDVPVALTLLGALQFLPSTTSLARFLSWLGKGSWGIYLGQMLVHELFHLLGYWPEFKSLVTRLIYAFVLLVAGAALATVGAALRDRARQQVARAF
jgi:peptidoglycan/LPS O-acetylase OafA/YrhL